MTAALITVSAVTVTFANPAAISDPDTQQAPTAAAEHDGDSTPTDLEGAASDTADQHNRFGTPSPARPGTVTSRDVTQERAGSFKWWVFAAGFATGSALTVLVRRQHPVTTRDELVSALDNDPGGLAVALETGGDLRWWAQAADEADDPHRLYVAAHDLIVTGAADAADVLMFARAARQTGAQDHALQVLDRYRPAGWQIATGLLGAAHQP